MVSYQKPSGNDIKRGPIAMEGGAERERQRESQTQRESEAERERERDCYKTKVFD